MVVHLLPEQLACIGVVGIVEGAEIAWADPVADAVANGSLIHPSVFVKLLEVLGGDIEFWPHRNHYASVHCMDGIDHTLGVGESLAVKLMAAPCVLLPVLPVDDYVVDGYAAFAEFG